MDDFWARALTFIRPAEVEKDEKEGCVFTPHEKAFAGYYRRGETDLNECFSCGRVVENAVISSTPHGDCAYYKETIGGYVRGIKEYADVKFLLYSRLTNDVPECVQELRRVLEASEKGTVPSDFGTLTVTPNDMLRALTADAHISAQLVAKMSFLASASWGFPDRITSVVAECGFFLTRNPVDKDEIKCMYCSTAMCDLMYVCDHEDPYDVVLMNLRFRLSMEHDAKCCMYNVHRLEPGALVDELLSIQHLIRTKRVYKYTPRGTTLVNMATCVLSEFATFASRVRVNVGNGGYSDEDALRFAIRGFVARNNRMVCFSCGESTMSQTFANFHKYWCNYNFILGDSTMPDEARFCYLDAYSAATPNVCPHTCRVCMEKEIAYFTQCGHGVCGSCLAANRMEVCPHCRTRVYAVIKLYSY